MPQSMRMREDLPQVALCVFRKGGGAVLKYVGPQPVVIDQNVPKCTTIIIIIIIIIIIVITITVTTTTVTIIVVIRLKFLSSINLYLLFI
jgi:hypothetical protein